MYTKLDDERQSKLIVNYMNQNPKCTRKDIVQDTQTTWTRLKSLEIEGYFKLPRILSHGERNGFARKNN